MQGNGADRHRRRIEALSLDTLGRMPGRNDALFARMDRLGTLSPQPRRPATPPAGAPRPRRDDVEGGGLG